MGVEPRASIEVRALLFTYAKGEGRDVSDSKRAMSRGCGEMYGE